MDVQADQDCPATSMFHQRLVAEHPARQADQDREELPAQDHSTFHLHRERRAEVVETESSILRRAIATKIRIYSKTPIKSLKSKKCHFRAGCPQCSFAKTINLFI